jgi:hypothetical protein
MVEILTTELYHKIRRLLMKQILRNTGFGATAAILAAFFVGILPSVLQAQSFEGVVEYKVTTEEGTMPMTYMMKGDNVRVEMEGRPGMKMVLLLDTKEGKTVMLMEKMKMYMEMPSTPPPESDEAKPEVTKTGKSQKILGYECQQFLVKEGDKSSDVWITKELGKFQMFKMGGPRGRNNDEAWQKLIGDEGGFPLLATTKEGDEQLSKMEATRIEKKSLDDVLFKIPDGYKPMDSSMMRRPGQ